MVCELKLRKLFGHLGENSQAAGEGSDPGTSLSLCKEETSLWGQDYPSDEHRGNPTAVVEGH